LLTALDKKLQTLKFAILFISADMCWVKKQEAEDAKAQQQNIHSPWGEPVANYLYSFEPVVS